MSQGFSSAEAGLVALVSKDMNAHDAYMAEFMEVFADLDWWGPGTADATCRALTMVPFEPETILEIGCGPGMATMTLAEAQLIAAKIDTVFVVTSSNADFNVARLERYVARLERYVARLERYVARLERYVVLASSRWSC